MIDSGISESAVTIMTRASLEKYYLFSKQIIVDGGNFVKFKRDGEIISTGYGLPSREKD